MVVPTKAMSSRMFRFECSTGQVGIMLLSGSLQMCSTLMYYSMHKDATCKTCSFFNMAGTYSNNEKFKIQINNPLFG